MIINREISVQYRNLHMKFFLNKISAQIITNCIEILYVNITKRVLSNFQNCTFTFTTGKQL